MKYNTDMISLAVQAGGRSSRMGVDKALIELDGKPLFHHVLERLEGLAEDVFITTNNPAISRQDVRVVPDADPGAGALNGLITALEAANGDPVLVAACDMPFVSRELFIYMLDRSDRYDVVIPCPGGFYEPMHAVYAASALPAVRAALENDEKRVISFLADVRALLINDAVLQEIDSQGTAFFNINTPDDLKRAEGLLEKRSRKFDAV